MYVNVFKYCFKLLGKLFIGIFFIMIINKCFFFFVNVLLKCFMKFVYIIMIV